MFESTLGLSHLPNDYGKPNRAFYPYPFRARRALEWIRGNWLPVALFAVGLAIA